MTRFKNNKIFHFLLPLAIFISIELIQYHSFTQFFTQVRGNPLPFFIGYLIVLCFFSVIACLVTSIPIAVLLVSFIGILSSLVNYFKLIARGEPFYPLDITLAASASDIASFVDIGADKYIVFSVLVCAAAAAGSFFVYGKLKTGRKARAAIIFASCFLLYLLSFHTSFKYNILGQKCGILYFSVYPEKPYRQNGFTFSFVSNLEQAYIQKPSSYSEAQVEQLVSQISQDNRQELTTGRKPNIIVFLSESFWDATQFPNVTFNRDPIPFFRSLTSECISGDFVSCGTGGGTANVEFEILTGFSMKNLPYGVTPYVQYIKRPTPSIPSYLKEEYGYRTIAMHSYDKTFYKRNIAYPNMGFDTFIGDEDMEEAKWSGGYISDAYLVDCLIDEYEKSQEPVFIHAISMQNHMPYSPDKYKEYEISLESAVMEAGQLGSLNAYVEGLRYQDEALEQMVSYFSAVEEPTIMLFFGDHFPAVDMDRQFYVDMGYISSVYSDSWSNEDVLKMYKAPFLIWKNYGNEKKALPLTSSANLGVMLLQEAGIEPPLFFKFLDDFYKQLPVYHKVMTIDAQEGRMYENVPGRYGALTGAYELLQYDLMFGKQYAGH